MSAARAASATPPPPRPVQGGKAPVNFAKTEAKLTQASRQLDKLDNTGSAVEKWGGVYITGSNKSVEVFDLSSSALKNSTYFNLSGISRAPP
jgi:choice-of-anchor A domain-containing protein